ncbi:MAG: type II toxin-antitoxin system RatA family toxin [Marinicella sp.]|nr:type II toxin-antitoxin system RatA family toxin [Xanthomonadales bacterium]
MAEIIKSAIVPYVSKQMLDLVNQVESYPDFLRWCKKGFIKETFENGYVAGMLMKISGVEVEFATRNTIEKAGDDINLIMVLETGPFKKLSGQWQFHQFPAFGSKVELQLQYEIKSQILGKMFTRGFDQLAASLVNDFVNRAGVMYDR